jgi:hypothetical protein
MMCSRLIMQVGVLGILLTSTLATGGSGTSPSGRVDDELRSAFDGWLERHDKAYFETEYQKRFTIFHQNHALVQKHNAAYDRGYTSYTMTIDGPFADTTDEEFAALYLMDSQNCSATTSSGKLRNEE